MSRPALVVLTVLLALVVLRVRATQDVGRGVGFPDAYHYADIGRQLARGDGLTTQQTYPYVLAWLRNVGLDRTPPWPNVARFPLLPLVYAPAFRVAGASEAVVRWVGEAIWVATAVATALLAALLFGNGVALVVLAFQLLSLAPLGLARGGLPDQPASLAIVAATLGVALLTRAAAPSGTVAGVAHRTRRTVTALALGCGLGAAFLLRYDLLALLAAAPVALAGRRSAAGRRQALLVFAGCALPVGAWLLHDALLTGAPGTYLGLDRNLLGRADVADVYASLRYENPWRVLARDPAVLPEKLAQLAWPPRNWRNLFGWRLGWLGPLALLSCVWLVRSAVIASTETERVAWFADRPAVRALPSQIAATERLGVRIDGLLYPSSTRDGVRQNLQRQQLDAAFVEVSSGPSLTLWLRQELVAQWRARAGATRPAQAG